MTQVFISYSRKDQAFVQRLAADLEARFPDVKVFHDMLIQPGPSWADTLAAQIEKSDVILALLSPEYLESSWAQQELNVALDSQLNTPARLLPLMVRPCTPTGFLSLLTLVDFTDDYERALAQLIWGITGERPQAAKGDKPGLPISALDMNEVDSLRREVQAAVELFKSRTEPASPPRTARPAAQVRTDEKRRCFVVMPFGNQDLQVVYEDFVKPTLVDACDIHCERGDDVFGSNVVMDDILKSIGSSR